MLRTDLSTNDYASYYEPYLALVENPNALIAQEEQIVEFRSVLDQISEAESEKLHAPFTWTIKQVVDHLNNNEKVFGYRALRFSVGDENNLIGYDQDMFAANANLHECSLKDLTDELEHTRRSNLLMFKRFTPEAWERSGMADGKNISVRAIAFLQAGHLTHHLNIVKKRIS